MWQMNTEAHFHFLLSESKGSSDLIYQEGSVPQTQESLSLAKREWVDILWEAE